MNILTLVHWPWWTPWALWGLAALVVLLVLGSLKSLIGWPGLAVLAIALALVAGEADGARRALDWTHSHYHIKGHVTDFVSVFW